ncbi:sensor domain-containing diguanylate cyclase [Pseudomonas sp. 148P]|uniref:Sensor domain-containing diguanylate cyclase n=1 Tax=Pseudomonas ulcerans TaxID=3115852 RepID=A0ABU7HMX9_9PSED|nr:MULTISPECIES: sensor domain-containing diguanylate cyclase [unclassified Pseudomonas]MEE1922410.1 sensor domain-containing diguanylate cyclase [Pseudomonas sp. 147P]MEE1932884.1 sensor domain-containing diguanylate cyclase [Pseudomonas sp. 148P]
MTAFDWLALGTSLMLLVLLLRARRRERQLRARLAVCQIRLDNQPQSPPAFAPRDDSERYQRSQYFARIGTWDWDIDTETLYWSDAIFGMFGYQVGEITPSYERFCNAVHPDDRAQVRAGELRCIETGDNHDEEYRVVWPDGSIHWLRETGNIVCNADGVAVKMIGVVREITEEKAWASQLQQLAHSDALTGLPNRLVLEHRLLQALEQAREHQGRVTLVFLDLNGFKAINDQHGHAVGDRVLVLIARRLKQMLRAADTVARIGGDEFVLVLDGMPEGEGDEAELHTLCRRLIDTLAEPISLAEGILQVGSSLGVAVFPQHATGMDTLLHAADLAMYEAKRSGDNQYRLGSQGLLAVADGHA